MNAPFFCYIGIVRSHIHTHSVRCLVVLGFNPVGVTLLIFGRDVPSEKIIGTKKPGKQLKGWGKISIPYENKGLKRLKSYENMTSDGKNCGVKNIDPA